MRREVRLRPGTVSGLRPFRFGTARTVQQPHRFYGTIGYHAFASNQIAWRRLKKQFHSRRDAVGYAPEVYRRLERLWTVAHPEPPHPFSLAERIITWIWRRIAWLHRRLDWRILVWAEKACQKAMAKG